MKQRHVETARANARATLANLSIRIDQDFHTLNGAQVDGLLQEAIRVRYQRPKGANGSRARYFCNRLQRQAKGRE